MIKVDWRVLKSHDLVISFNDRLSKKLKEILLLFMEPFVMNYLRGNAIN